MGNPWDFAERDKWEREADSLEQRPLSVGELAEKIRSIIESKFLSVWVEGEVTGFKEAASGHVYFSIKDEKALIDCVIWRTQRYSVGTLPRDGDNVEIRGHVTTYALRSCYQIIVKKIEPAGLGKLYQRFIQLRDKLEREGLLAEERKRPLPPYPRTVGIVTSPKGAALRDMIKILRRRAPHIRILLSPTRVQGEGAAEEIAQAIRKMNELGQADVLIVGRGGGSMEDLWPFNEEIVARAIASSRIPVISAVGHEPDVTIADYVADKRAPTPSAAAEIVSQDAMELRRRLEHERRRMHAALRQKLAPLQRARDLRQRLVGTMRQRIGRLQRVGELAHRLREQLRARFGRLQHVRVLREKLCGISRTLVQRRREKVTQLARRLERRSPRERLNELRQFLDDLYERMDRSLERKVRFWRQRQEVLTSKLLALDPKAVLARGYSITFDVVNHCVLRNASETKEGRDLRIILHQGELGARVTWRRLGSAPPPSCSKSSIEANELPLDFSEGEEQA